MDTITIISRLNKINDDFCCSDRPICEAIKSLRDELTRNYSVKSAAPSMKTRLRAVHNFAKECMKVAARASLAGAFIAPDTQHITLCEGIMLWASPTHVDGLPMVSAETSQLLDVKPILQVCKYEQEYSLPDLQQLKNDFALACATSGSKKKQSLHETVLEDETTVSTRRLILCMSMLGGIKTYRHRSGTLTALYMEAEDGSYCVLLPMRKQSHQS